MLGRRLRTLLAIFLFGAAQLASQAQPAITRLVVTFPPGGPTDQIARLLAQRLSSELGEQVIVENKPGANGNIGTDSVVRSKPDGSTLLLATVGPIAISPALYASLPYDPIRDLAPVSLVVTNDVILVVKKNHDAKDAAEFAAKSKRAGAPIAMGSAGMGGIPHMSLELFNASSGAQTLHVPYKGAAQALSDVMGGQVTGFFADAPGVISLIKGGKLKALGISAASRHPLLSDVKTLDEQGIKGAESNNWYAIFAPTKTPQARIEQLNGAIRRSLDDEAVRTKIESMGSKPAASTAAELASLVFADSEKWKSLIKQKGIRAE